MEWKWNIRIVLNSGKEEYAEHKGQHFDSLEVGKYYLERMANEIVSLKGRKGQLFIKPKEIAMFEVYI